MLLTAALKNKGRRIISEPINFIEQQEVKEANVFPNALTS